MIRIIPAAFLLSMLLLVYSCKKEEPVFDTVDFENLSLGISGYWNGSDGSGGFTSGNATFVNHYNPVDQTWSGFAYTNHTDSVTADESNVFSSIAGEGAYGSGNYGVFLYSGIPDTLFFTVPENIINISVSNTTYAYYSMLNGSPSCKKFGGATGDDPDFFELIITAIDVNDEPVGFVKVTLADFHYTDNSYDFISNVWTNIDLSDSKFGYVKALVFDITSSDYGPGGINTPAYICIDNIYGELDATLE